MKKNHNRGKLEPFSYAELASSSALNGMMSFLEISPTEAQRITSLPYLDSLLTPANESSPPVEESSAGEVSSMIPVEATSTDENTSTVEVSSPVIENKELKINTVEESSTDEETPPVEDTSSIELFSTGKVSSPAEVVATGEEISPIEAIAVPALLPRGQIYIPPVEVSSPVANSYPDEDPSPVELSSTGDKARPGKSKIRKAVRAQDGHSLGEQALYAVLWRDGKTESDPNGSRITRMGYAELASKVGVSKRSVFSIVPKLVEKLSIDIIGEHIPNGSVPKSYRIYSYSQILERRREQGFLFYVKNKGVTFVSEKGVPLHGEESSTGEVSSLDERSSRALRRTIDYRLNEVSSIASTVETSTGPMEETSTQYREVFLGKLLEKKDREKEQEPTTSFISDLEDLAQYFSAHLGADQAASRKLLQDCRQVQADAQVDEIKFFLDEKIGIIQKNGQIANPVGFILATVPLQFEGRGFLAWRRRREEQARIAAEEEARREKEQRDLLIYFEQEAEKYKTVLNDPESTEQEKTKAKEWLNRYRY